MKRLLRPLLVAFFMLAFSATAAFAQSGSGTVTGKAVRWNGDAIAGATMRALTGPLETAKEVARTTTAADGSYSLSVPAGTPYWIHIDTFGSWWGYSYQTPFTLRPGETISQVYFALGPRDVKEIALPAPVSNVGPAVGVNEPPPAAPAPAAPAPAPAAAPAPAVSAAPAPVSNVKPAIGVNEPQVAVAPRPAPATLPQTGESNQDGLWIGLTAAMVLAVAGLNLRRASRKSR
jgi:LPXTG-motif cell wall-anchored protein